MNFLENELIKPLAAGGIAYAFENQYFKQSPMSSMKFGAAVAAGIFVGSSVDTMLGIQSSKVLTTGKGLENRVIEIGSAAGAGYALNKYILKNDFTNGEMVTKLMEIAIADIGAEYLIAAMKST